jgi:hypothetical protein
MAGPSGSDGLDGRVDAIVDGRFDLGDYERWLSREPSPSDEYLFAEARPRFAANERDVLMKPGDLGVVAVAHGVELRSATLGGGKLVPQLSGAAAERVLAAIDGSRTVAEVAVAVGADRPAFERVLAKAVGSVLFVPTAVAQLEARVSGTELVRFVGTPYEIVRSYWENMADVRGAAQASWREPDAAETFTRWLRRLHVVALLGRSLQRFYRPASKIAASKVHPGALYETATRYERKEGRTLLVAGPRIGVNLVGGARYHELVCAHDTAALAPERRIVDDDGLSWGEVVTGRGPEDSADAAWFCPPRPIEPAHWQKLFSAFAAARASTPSAARATPRELARFHYRFVRLHPFRCANQSLAMSIVNLVLAEAFGVGMPHLLLDQFALRLGEAAYVEVFERAVTLQAVPGPTMTRWARLREQKLRAYALLERLKTAKSVEAARALAAAEPEAARAALIT